MPVLHQFVPTLEPGATGNHALEIQRLLRSRGWRSELFCYETKPPLEQAGYDYREYGRRVRADPDDLLLYHVAIGSVVADWVMEREERLLLYFHNITPPEYFDRWEPFAAYACSWALSQLRRLVPRTTFAMAASEFSQADLAHLGYLDTAVVPILFDTAQSEAEADGATRARLESARLRGGAQWLFIGRLSPNKAQEDIIKAFAVYRRAYDPDARLAILGSDAESTYGKALRQYVNALGLAGAVEIPGGVADPVKVAYLHTSDVFVYLSEHEGFGVPILEAWCHRLPVVAFDAGAIGEVAGDGALLLEDKAPTMVAAAVHRMLSDAELRSAIEARAAKRLELFGLDRTQTKFMEIVESVRGARR